MLVEEISGEGDAVSHTTSEKVTNRLGESFPYDIEACNFESREGAVDLVERVFAGDKPGLGGTSGNVLRSRILSGELLVEAGKLKGVAAKDERASRLKSGSRRVAAVAFCIAGYARVGLQFEDGAQSPRCVKTVGTAQRWICDGNGVKFQGGDGYLIGLRH